MAENGPGPDQMPELFDQAKDDAIQVREIEPEVAAVELQQQVDRIKREIAAIEDAKRVPQDVLDLVVSI